METDQSALVRGEFHILANSPESNNEVRAKGRNVDADNSLVIVFKLISNRCLHIPEKMARGPTNPYSIVHILYLD